jgi:diguanylate cyclase (GGDEF)-like protein
LSISFLRRLLAVLACAVAIAGTAAADAGAERWTGLSDALFTHHAAPGAAGATVLAQDGRGFLWVGSQAGLARWDGYRLRQYTADPQTPGSLPDNHVLALHVDERDRLWIGTNEGGLVRYDPALDRFVAPAAGGTGLSSARAQAITGDGAGGLWVGTGVGLDHVDASGAVEPGHRVAMSIERLPEGGVRALLSDRGGTLWIGTMHGLWRRDRGAPALVTVPLGTPDGSPPAVATIYQDSAGRTWVGTRGHGAFVIDAGASRARPVHAGTAAAGLQSDHVMSIVEALAGEVWLGTEGGGIVAVDLTGESIRRIRHRVGMPTSLGDDDVAALFRDRSGLVWVATDTALSRHDPQQRAVVTLFGAAERPDGISQANVVFVLPMPDGRVWLSVGGGGVDIVDPLQGRVGQLRPDATRPESALPKGRAYALAAGPGGEVYIGTQKGLYRSDAGGRNVVHLNVPGRSPVAEVWSLCFDAGVLWLGGFDGLWALDLRGSPDRSALPRHVEAARLGASRVTSIVRGLGRSLWVGTNGGLVHVDTDSGAVDRVPTDTADPTRLPPGYVSSMLVDATGRLWVSSFGVGVQVLERRDADGRLWFRRLGLRDGLPDTGVDKLLEAANGDIWASTDNGLAVIDGHSFAIRALQFPQGVGIRSHWTNAGAVGAGGELLFGGAGGLTVARPERLTRQAFPAPVVVTDSGVGSAPSTAARSGPADPTRAGLVVSPDDRRVWVEFAALDYSAPERNRYAYRLQGFDSDWTVTEATDRRASYTNLPPGAYTLQLRGSNRDGEWTQPPLQIPIRVLPAWYQTAWFRAAAALCAFGLLGALVQARTVYLRRRQRELQSLVDVRTAELEGSSEELRKSQRLLERIAYADPLTGVPNRRLFNDDLLHRTALAARGGGPFALLLIDLDGFKHVNDTLGHDAGDALLIATATRLTQLLRDADRVARMGGDEFAVLLTQSCDREAVDTVCRRILDAVAGPLTFGGATMQISASVGVALCPDHGVVPDVLYKAADVALYEAKRNGRNTWRWHEPASAGPPHASRATPAAAQGAGGTALAQDARASHPEPPSGRSPILREYS